MAATSAAPPIARRSVAGPLRPMRRSGSRVASPTARPTGTASGAGSSPVGAGSSERGRPTTAGSRRPWTVTRSRPARRSTSWLDCRESDAFDSFEWAPIVRVETADGDVLAWDAEDDFSGPHPAPPTPEETVRPRPAHDQRIPVHRLTRADGPVRPFRDRSGPEDDPMPHEPIRPHGPSRDPT